MKRIWVAGIVTATAGLFSISAAPAALIVDDFEGYTNSQQLSQGTGSATSPSSPWLRFGTGANGHIAATSSTTSLDGLHSGSIPLTWSGGATNATFRYGLGSATNLAGYSAAQVTIRSTNAGTTAKVQLSFSDNVSSATGETTYVTTTPVQLTGTAQTLTFAIDPALMNLTGGSHSFASALASVYSIGFRFSNTTGQANESVIIDDFQLLPVPEPASVGLTTACALALASRRRRRPIA